MTENRKLFERFKTEDDKPHYLSEEDISKIPTSELVNRLNLLQLLEIRLQHISNIMDVCTVSLKDEGTEDEQVDKLIVCNSLGDCMGFKRDENGSFDEIALNMLYFSHWFATKELNDLFQGITDYEYGVLDYEYHKRLCDSKRCPSTMAISYEYSKGEFNRCRVYAPLKDEK